MKKCLYEGCEKPVYIRERCNSHYRKDLDSGVIQRKIKRIAAPARKLVENTINDPQMDMFCIEWPFSRDRNGYGNYQDGTIKRAHRVILEAVKGPPPSPEKNIAAHNCDNPSCVNPAHLRWATTLENNLDRFADKDTRSLFAQ